jgi:hypothetical protein
MFVDFLLEQLRANCQVTVFEKELETVHFLRNEPLNGECWMDDLYDYSNGPEYESPDDESWMDDLDEAA